MELIYYSLNQYLKDTFGCKVYKVALDGGFTCPNRDGTIGNSGCIFCSAGGSGDFASDRSLSITKQLEEGKRRISRKLPKDKPFKFIAYFQAFTNTYGPIDKLRSLYYEAINDEEVCAISIATRPDCLGDDVLALLDEINKIKPVWVELGLQTIHESTAAYIRRGYPLSLYDEAVDKLKGIGVEIITHVILGLPSESIEDMVATAKYVGESGVNGIKLQLLHVLKNTDLCKDYEAHKFETLSLDEYVDIVEACIKVLPENMVIHRLTGDGDKKILVAPLWSADKKNVINTLSKRLKKDQ